MNKLVLTAAVIGAFGWAGVVDAQTCAADSIQTISAATTVTGDSCYNGTGSGASTAVSAVCSGATPLNGSGEVVYALQLGATNSVSVSLQSTGTGATSGCSTGAVGSDTCPFEAGLWVLNPSTGTCGGQACSLNQQATAQGTTVQGNLATNKAAGTYFIVVGDSGADNINNPGCGPYTLAVSGTLPVKLQKFSVK